MPGGEYDQFDDDLRLFRVRARICQITACSCLGVYARQSRLLRQLRDDTALLLAAQFVPFVQGPRNCLGQFFALLEGRVVLALLVKVRSRPPLLCVLMPDKQQRGMNRYESCRRAQP